MLAKLLAIVLALSTIALGVQTWRLHDAKADLKVAVDAVKTLTANQTALTKSVASEHAAGDQLKTALDACTGQQQATDDARTAAEAHAADADRQRKVAEVRLAAERGKIYATDQTCDAWGRAPMCGALSRELRDRWTARGGDGGPRGGEARAAVRGHPAVADGAGSSGPASGPGYPQPWRLPGRVFLE